jgi:hypothetical protein
MSVDNPAEVLPEEVVEAWWSEIHNLISKAKEYFWDDSVDKFLNGIKKWPIIWPMLSEIMGKSTDERAVLSGELEHANEYAWLTWLDLRGLASQYPWEASFKNNNLAWLSYFPSITNKLDAQWIKYSKWSARPASEKHNYIQFPDLAQWAAAYKMWWDEKFTKAGDSTVSDFAKSWAEDASSYKNLLGDFWDKPISSLSNSEKDEIQLIQMKIESPWMLTELKKRGLLNTVIA